MSAWLPDGCISRARGAACSRAPRHVIGPRGGRGGLRTTAQPPPPWRPVSRSDLARTAAKDAAEPGLLRERAALLFPDPFADASKGDDLLPAGTEDYIHIRIQQRNGRKTLTTVQGIADDYDKKKLVKAFKKVGTRRWAGTRVALVTESADRSHCPGRLSLTCSSCACRNLPAMVPSSSIQNMEK